MTNLKSLIRNFPKEYGQRAADMEKVVLHYLNKGISPEKAVAKAFAKFDFEENITEAIKDTQLKAVGVGLGVETVNNSVVAKALNTSWSGDGVTFSERLHGTAKEMREAMVKTIADQLKLNASVKETAKALYDGYGYGKVIKPQEIPDYLNKIVSFARHSELTDTDRANLLKMVRQTTGKVESLGDNASALKTAYKGVLKAVENGSEKALQKAVDVAINEKSRWVAERIARTEAARAYFDGFATKWGKDDMCIAYKWNLGTAHDIVDECDMYAEADLFNLGEGIFPKDQVPECPVHPNCLCQLMPVFKGEVDMGKMKNQVQKGGKEWLEKQPLRKQRNVLGYRGAEKFKKDGNWQDKAHNFRGFINPLERSRLFKMDLQLHAKHDKIISETDNNLQNVAEVYLPQAEYAQVLSELKTNLTKEQVKEGSFTKCIGDFVYTVKYENHEFKILNKDFIDSVWESYKGENK